MKDPNLETVVRKIRKLLALADKNSHEGEMTSAALMAQKLMAEHNLSLSEVQVKEIKEEGLKKDAATFRRNCVPWERTLASAVATLFDTYTYRHHKYDDTGRKLFAMMFMGLGAEAQISAEAYEALRESLKHMGKKSPYRGPSQGAYLLGVAHRLCERATQQRLDLVRQAQHGFDRPSAPNPEPAPCTALVAVKERLIEEEKTKIGIVNMRQRPIGGTAESYNRGKRDGNSVSLNFRKNLKSS